MLQVLSDDVKLGGCYIYVVKGEFIMYAVFVVVFACLQSVSIDLFIVVMTLSPAYFVVSQQPF